MDVTDELELWQRARQEDGSAFAQLFDLHHARIYARALAMVGNIHEADDIAAAAFFELWRKRRSVPIVGGSIRPWLLVTTVNLSRNSRRAAARYRGVLRNLPRPEFTERADDAGDSSERLTASIAGLSPVDAALLVLTVLEDVSVAEAAQAVGVKPATARVRLHRARSRLRAELQDLGAEMNTATEGSAT